MVDELKEFTKRAKDILANVAFTGRMKYLDFLNVSEQEIMAAMVKKYPEVQVKFAGGFSVAERCRAIIAPTYISEESIDSKVSMFKIEVIGTGEVTHSQVLGSLMGLNIARNVIGDISVINDNTVDANGAFFAACSEFDGFLLGNFTKIGHCDIHLIVWEEPVVREALVENIEVIVSSMRLDVIVKALVNVSRTKAEAYLEAGFVRHNHVVEKKVSRICSVGDILSIRRVGRFKIVDNKKTTKSGKIVLVASKSL